MKHITFWSKSDTYKELSNFYPCKIKLEMYGKEYTFQSAESAYQAHKVTEGNVYLFSKITPLEAKSLIKTFPLLDQWGELMKEAAMWHVLEAKFTQHENLRQLLVDTYPTKLIHWAPWDNYWGWSKDNNGWNRLGELMMELRDELR